jgi:hypothetical protein
MDDWHGGLSTSSFFQQRTLTCLEAIRDGGSDSIEVSSVLNRFDYDSSVDFRLVRSHIRELQIKANSAERATGSKKFLQTAFRAACLSDRKDQ